VRLRDVFDVRHDQLVVQLAAILTQLKDRLALRPRLYWWDCFAARQMGSEIQRLVVGAALRAVLELIKPLLQGPVIVFGILRS